MKKIVALLTVLGGLSFSFTGYTQTANGRVTGSISSSQKKIESASVGLLRSKDSSVVKLAVSDKSGQFEIDNVKQGKYLLSVQSLGHMKFYGPAFEISEANPSYTLANIELKAVSKELKEVTVVSQKPLIEQKIDRTVVNVDAAVSNT